LRLGIWTFGSVCAYRSRPQLLRTGAPINCRGRRGTDEAELAVRGAGTSLTGKVRMAAAVAFAGIHLMPLTGISPAGIQTWKLSAARRSQRRLGARRRRCHVVVGTPTYFAWVANLRCQATSPHEAVTYHRGAAMRNGLFGETTGNLRSRSKVACASTDDKKCGRPYSLAQVSHSFLNGRSRMARAG
jgi:hypothetical protein